MKRNLFAIFLAMALVVALVFVVAPSAKAEAVAFVDGMTISENTTIDLAGQSGTINVAEGVKLSVIDSKNTGISGEGAGKLIVNGEVEVEAVDETGRRFLAVPNDDGSYSFHPFYLTIKQVGINTNEAALCLQAMFVTNEVAQEAITTGILYGENAESLTSAAGTYGAFSFENGVMYAYYDLIGSLADESAMNAERAFQAYIKVGDATVTSKTVATVSPKAILERMNNDISAFTETQRAKMVAMIAKNSQLEDPCNNFFSKGFKLVTDASELAIGDKIVIAAKGYNYALSTQQNSNNRAQAAIIKNDDKIILNNNVQVLTLKEGKTSGTFAFYTGAGYLYAASSSSNYLKTETTLSANSSWSVSIASDSTATIKATGTYTRNVMQYNDSSSLFACYSSASQKAIVVYKESLIPACVTHEGTDATCTQASTCVNCGTELGQKLDHFDSADDTDHICDNGCKEQLSNCTFDANHTCNCGKTTDCVNDGGKCKYCGKEMAEIVKTTVTMKYTSATTTNMTGSNDASKVNLDSSIFTVKSDKNGNGNHIGLNKDGTIRMYSSSGKNNKLIVSVADGYTIASIKINFKTAKATEVLDASGALIEKITASGTVEINDSSFTLINTSGAQSQINSIEITYY